jgi:hypothetical protein
VRDLAVAQLGRAQDDRRARRLLAQRLAMDEVGALPARDLEQVGHVGRREGVVVVERADERAARLVERVVGRP